MSNLKIETVSPLDIKMYKQNPKKHNPKQVQQIASSIQEFKFNNPILIDGNNEIIAGHGRLLAAAHLKMDAVPVIRLTHLTDEQKRAYRIADNKLTENGEWDYDLLKIEIKNLEELNIDFDLNITGFETAELDLILNPKAIDKAANMVPFIREEEIISKPGDIWQLGKHKIICGNSLEKETFSKLLEDKIADLIFTDPPYNVKIDGHVCGGGSVKHKEFEFASGEMKSEEFRSFLKQNFDLLRIYSKNGSIHFICMDWRHVQEIISAGTDYTELKNICVWNKDNGGMGSLYRSKHEFIFVYKNGKAPHTNNIELGKHGRYRTNVWEYAGVNSFGSTREDLKMHPTVKPVEMIMDAIQDVSNRGQIVLDSFLGSGSTLMAAEKTRRICYGIELDPLYIDTTIRRWETLTKQDAVLVSQNKTYKSLLEEKLCQPIMK